MQVYFTPAASDSSASHVTTCDWVSPPCSSLFFCGETDCCYTLDYLVHHPGGAFSLVRDSFEFTMHYLCYKAAYLHAWADVYTKLFLTWVDLIAIILYSHKVPIIRNYTSANKAEGHGEVPVCILDRQSDFCLIAADTLLVVSVNVMQFTVHLCAASHFLFC